jgi:SAM-dependent methyltransferase
MHMTPSAADEGSQARSPLASAEPWDLVADAYTTDLVSWGEHFARHALQLAALPPSPHIVDVACGPGTLALLAAREGATVSAIDFSPAMVANLKRRADEAGLAIVDARVGDGQDLPFDDDAFDGAFSMVGLMFFPDRAAGFRELHRVLRQGRRAVVSSIAEIPEQAALVFEGISAMLPDLPTGGNAPLRDADEFTREMAQAGFGQVTIHTISHTVSTPSLADYWEKVQRSTAPVVLLRRRLGEERWAKVAAGVFEQLNSALGDGPVNERYTMHLGVGIK